MFKLHEKLAQDTIKLADLELCELLLMNDAQYPWLILVPRRENIREIHQLSNVDQIQLIKEGSWTGMLLDALFTPEKINMAAIGNIVPQLHLHYIARYSDDIAWPGPVWGKFPAVRYSGNQLNELKNRITTYLNENPILG